MAGEVSESALTDAAEQAQEQVADVNPEATQQDERTFTQTELDAQITKRLAKEQRKNRRQMDELQAQLKALKETPPPAAKTETTETAAPKRSDFDTYEDYLEAKTEWKAEQKWAEKQKKQEEAEAKRQETARNEAEQGDLRKMADKRLEDGRKAYPDFDDVVNTAIEDGLIPAGSELLRGIIESDVGHDLAYYLAQPKNADELEALKDLNPRALNRALGKLEDKLAKGTKKPLETMDPVRAGRPQVKHNDIYRKDIAMEDFVRLRNEQEMKYKGLR
jgi:hypothetical protein